MPGKVEGRTVAFLVSIRETIEAAVVATFELSEPSYQNEVCRF